jgi:hypothetical protein
VDITPRQAIHIVDLVLHAEREELLETISVVLQRLLRYFGASFSEIPLHGLGRRRRCEFIAH